MNWAGLPRFRTYGIDVYVEQVRTDKVAQGVICHVYRIVDDDSRDLGIIEISPGCATPTQRVAADGKTAEGYLTGAGVLTTITDGSVTEYGYPGAEPGPVTVGRGSFMTWQAAGAGLVVSEICAPPWTPGRFAGLWRQHL